MAESDPHDLAAARKPGTEWTYEDFVALTRALGGRLYAFFCNRLGAFDAEDALQEVFLDAWKGRATFDPKKLGPGGINGWFGMIARSVCARILTPRHPRLIEIRTGKHWNVALNRPFQIPLFVSPPAAVFSIQNCPEWVTVSSKPKSKPNAQQFLSGSAPALGRFVISVAARLDGAEAIQELVLTIIEDGPPKPAPSDGGDKTGKPGHEGVARVTFESIEEHIDSIPDPSRPFWPDMDMEWFLACLSDREREVIVRTFWNDESDEEIETALGLNKGHVKRIRWIALRELKRRRGDDLSP